MTRSGFIGVLLLPFIGLTKREQQEDHIRIETSLPDGSKRVVIFPASQSEEVIESLKQNEKIDLNVRIRGTDLVNVISPPKTR